MIVALANKTEKVNKQMWDHLEMLIPCDDSGQSMFIK